VIDRVADAVARHGDRLVGGRAVWWLAGAALAMPIVALLLVVIADLVPDRWVMDHLFEATMSGALDTESYDRGYAGGLVDGFSECKRITVGLGDPVGRSTLESAVMSPTLGACDVAVPKIEGWAAGEGLSRSYDYARYWNGSAVVFRPLMALVGVTASRVIAGAAVAAATALYWLAARRRLGGTAAAIVTLTMALTVDFIDLPGALLHSLAWTVALLSAAVIMLLPTDSSNGAVAWWMFVMGGIFLFLADFTNPELAWALAVASVAFGVRPGRPARESLQRVVLAAGAWIAGFAWLWVAKWCIYAAVAGFDRAWDDVTGQIETRLDGVVGDATPTAWDALDRVWSAWWDAPLTSIVIPVFLVVTAVLVVRFRTPEIGLLDRAVMAAPAALPLLWYVLVRNHTYLHFWFVYRSLAVVAAVVLGACLVGRSAPERVRRR
jgi:hypothetical protein